MSTLYLYTKDLSHVNNQYTTFFNILSNNYYNHTTTSINYNIYTKILHFLDSEFNLDKKTEYNKFYLYITKYLYKSINDNIVDYLDIMIDNKKFLIELFKHTQHQYYTSSNNEILRLLSDNIQSEKTFNISKNYENFKTKYVMINKKEKREKLLISSIKILKNKLFEIYIILDGLDKLMYCYYNNLLEFKDYTFSQITNHVKELFGTTYNNFVSKEYIYYKYKNKTLNYIDIYNNILNNSDSKDNIVNLFIQINYIKFNEYIDKIIQYDKYKIVLHKLYKQFIDDKEEDEDEDILNLSSEQQNNILNDSYTYLYPSTIKNIIQYNNNIFVNNNEDYQYSYTDKNNKVIKTTLSYIPYSYINNLQFNNTTQSYNTNIDSISDNDIIKELLPSVIDEINVQPEIKEQNITNDILNEAHNRLNLIMQNKEDIDYINHTISFFENNFVKDTNLTQLIEAISYINHSFINTFNLNVLDIKTTQPKTIDDTNLMSTIMKELDTNTINDPTLKSNKNVFIIDDYNILSPVYNSNFKINISNVNLKFKSLLHYIYFNQYKILYDIYIKYTQNKEASIIPSYKFAYNLLLKNSLLNIFETNKTIFSDQTKFKSYTELQHTFHELFNNIRYYLFKKEIMLKINSNELPYYSYVLSNTIDMNIINSDKYDNFLGIGSRGNGQNKAGLFLVEYRDNLKSDFNYDYTDIFKILCNFNINIYNWLIYKVKDIINHIVSLCIITKTTTIDLLFVNKILHKIFPNYINDKVYKLKPHLSFHNFIINTIQNFTTKYEHTNINITYNAFRSIWDCSLVIIQNLYNFQKNIIDNSDKFQTFISKYNKHNPEHVLFYILSNYIEENTLDTAINTFTQNKLNLLKEFDSTIDYNPIINNLLLQHTDVDDYNKIISTYDKSLVFNINDYTEYINIIKSKLFLQQF